MQQPEKSFTRTKNIYRATTVRQNLKEQVGTGYYENLIKTYLLDNTHISFVSAEPKVGLSAQMEQEEKEKLKAYRETLSGEQLEQLVKETKELRAYQEEETPQELLDCIPILEREDIGKQALPFKNEERKIGEMPVLFHNIFTNGINYVKLSFDVKDLLPYAPYLSLLAELIGFVDTDKHDKLELSNEVLLHAGNFATNLNLYYNKKIRQNLVCHIFIFRFLYSQAVLLIH